MNAGPKLLIGAIIGFFLLVAMFILPPLSSEHPGKAAAVTIVQSDANNRGGIYFDHGPDFTTGTIAIHLPVWPLHLGLLLGMAGFLISGLAQDRRLCRSETLSETFRP